MAKTVGAKRGQYGNGIDKNTFEKLCSIFCTKEEVCAFFDCSYDTLNRWCKQTYNCTFKDVYVEKSSLGKISLRRLQFRHAETNPTMAIWLGKQYLGQNEKVETEVVDKIEVVSDVRKK